MNVFARLPHAADRLMFYASIARSAGATMSRRILKGAGHPEWPWLYELAMAALRTTIRDHYPLASKLARGQASPVPGALAGKVQFAQAQLAGRPVEIHQPRGAAASGATLLFLHGGGFSTCSAASYRHFLSRVALATGARCVAPDYALAPEHPFPAALEDAVACCRALNAAAPLFVAGDSAGGGLCLALLLELRETGERLPDAVALISPWVDLTLEAAGLKALGKHDYLPAERLVADARCYAGDAALDEPFISPIYADLSGLPPMLIQTGEWETFCEQNTRLAERARAFGVQVTHEIAPGMLHAFPCFAGILPQADAAIANIARFFRANAELRGPSPEASATSRGVAELPKRTS